MRLVILAIRLTRAGRYKTCPSAISLFIQIFEFAYEILTTPRQLSRITASKSEKASPQAHSSNTKFVSQDQSVKRMSFSPGSQCVFLKLNLGGRHEPQMASLSLVPFGRCCFRSTLKRKHRTCALTSRLLDS